jgi:hypothetical protein
VHDFRLHSKLMGPISCRRQLCPIYFCRCLLFPACCISRCAINFQRRHRGNYRSYGRDRPTSRPHIPSALKTCSVRVGWLFLIQVEIHSAQKAEYLSGPVYWRAASAFVRARRFAKTFKSRRVWEACVCFESVIEADAFLRTSENRAVNEIQRPICPSENLGAIISILKKFPELHFSIFQDT